MDALWSPITTGRKLQKSQLPDFDKRDFLRFCMQEHDGFYECYFNSLLNSGAELTGDITPEYSLLSSDDFLKLRKKIEYTRAEIKCVFLMRDPIERCWSATRHAKRQGWKNWDVGQSDEQSLMERFSTKQFENRTRYELICERLRSVFSDEELYFGIYETMFTDSEIERLSAFLNLPVKYEHRDKQSNQSPKTDKISNELREKIRRHYAETYDYCFENFEAAKLAW